MDPEGIAVVTGASRGIGRAVAIELAQRGFEVVAAARRPEAVAPFDAEPAAGRLRLERLDVTDPASMTLPEGLRVLVNNAGIEPEYLPVEHSPLDSWREIFDTNVFGLIEVTRRAIPRLRDSGGGVICNVTSSSLLAPVPFYAAYRASKAAVSAIGETLCAELAAFGIRVIEILPGPIETDMLAHSERMPEAARHPEYRAQAERYYAGREQAGSRSTPSQEAARRIANAILDDDAPLRNGCDDLASGMLEMWRKQSDEQVLRAMLPGFVAER